MRLYILIFLFVLNSVSFGLDLSNKLFKSNNILGKSHGGLGNDKDVYVDGVGVQWTRFCGKFQRI